MLLSAALIFVVSLSSSNAIVKYNVSEIPIEADSGCINNFGQIAGIGDSNAVIYDAASKRLTDLGTLPGSDGSFATAINNKGQVIGVAEWWDTGVYHGVLFDSTGQGRNIDLGTLANQTSTEPLSISDSGAIVGTAYNYYSGSIWDQRAVLFDSTGQGQNIDLGTLGGDFSSALSVNNNRQIVGTAWDGLGNIKAALFDTTGQANNIDLGKYNVQNEHSCAYSINNKGQIVGISPNGTAVIFDSTGQGKNIDLGTISGGNYSIALAINNKSQIVGWANDSEYNTKAVLFDSTGTGNNTDLNTLIDPALGTNLVDAFAINDSGWILCEGISDMNFPYNYTQYLLIPAVKTPANLRRVYSNTSQITIAWTDKAVDEKGFYVERSANGKTGWARIATVKAKTGTGTVIYTNTNLKRKTKYFYRVQAYNSTGAVLTAILFPLRQNNFHQVPNNVYPSSGKSFSPAK